MMAQALDKKRYEFVETLLGNSVICKRCDCTLGTYSDACTAGLSEACPGFLAIEERRREFAKCQCKHCCGTGKVRYYHGDRDTCPTCHGKGAA